MAAQRTKRHRHGTDRIARPIETLARVIPVARAIGVTRLADVTGLDRIGIPVFQAIRPMARSLSVSQGKGATRAAARVSALMEAIELHHAEAHPIAGDTVLPGPDERVFCEAVLPARHQAAAFDPHRKRHWCVAQDLIGGRMIRVPHDLVSMDFARPLPDDLWPSSNGLASGNSRDEALVSALCEVIERDAHARWLALPPSGRAATALDPATIDDRLGCLLVRRVTERGFMLRLWDLSERHGVAVIACAITEPEADGAIVLPPAFGAGCHPVAAIALVRAITEAAQTRATLIAGARDDIRPADYAAPASARFALAIATLNFGRAARDWRAVPTVHHDDIAADRDWLIDRCIRAEAPVIACVDLTHEDHGIPVIKIIVPGFGDHDRMPAPAIFGEAA